MYPKINKTQLFDLKADPDELKDLSEDPQHGGTLKEMRARLQQQQQELGDKAPLSSTQPQPTEFDFSAVKRGAAKE